MLRKRISGNVSILPFTMLRPSFILHFSSEMKVLLFASAAWAFPFKHLERLEFYLTTCRASRTLNTFVLDSDFRCRLVLDSDASRETVRRHSSPGNHNAPSFVLCTYMLSEAFAIFPLRYWASLMREVRSESEIRSDIPLEDPVENDLWSESCAVGLSTLSVFHIEEYDYVVLDIVLRWFTFVVASMNSIRRVIDYGQHKRRWQKNETKEKKHLRDERGWIQLQYTETN